MPIIIGFEHLRGEDGGGQPDPKLEEHCGRNGSRIWTLATICSADDEGEGENRSFESKSPRCR